MKTILNQTNIIYCLAIDKTKYIYKVNTPVSAHNSRLCSSNACKMAE